jgi:NAD(P)-dependent dehydrogenase (short-subunit alcohol dehydrogenase family)
MKAKSNPPPRTVVITGASAGVGRASAIRFAREGARIGLLARGSAGLEAAKRDVERLGGSALIFAVDVADPHSVETAADEIERHFGPIDVWVNNAMVSVYSPVKQMTVEEFRRVTEVTYLGCVYGTLAALKRMLPRDRGVIVQVGSALAYRSIPLQSAYCAAKHAMKGFTESLRCELLHDNSHVRVTMVQLPALNTPQFGWAKSRLPRKAQPIPPIFQPEVAADAIYFAANNPRREFYVGWPSAKAIIGEKVAPGLIDHYLGRTGYDSAQYDGPEDPHRPDNLFEPVPDDHGAHGVFDSRSKSWSAQWWMTTNRGIVVLIGALLTAIAVFLFWR